MCLYFQENTSCPHPECIYMDNVRVNFSHDFQRNNDKLSQIELKHNWPQTFRQNKLKLNQNDKKQSYEDRYETKKDKKSNSSAQKKHLNGDDLKKFEVGQFIDSDLKLLLSQDVADFIFHMSSKLAENLKAKNNSDEQRLRNLEQRLQSLQRKNMQEEQ